MSSATIRRDARSPYTRLLWAVAGVVLLAQLAAMFWLCSQQVNDARVRQAATQIYRGSISNCLQGSSEANVGTCRRQLVTANTESAFTDGGVVTISRRAAGVALSRNSISSAAPVSFDFR